MPRGSQTLLGCRTWRSSASLAVMAIASVAMMLSTCGPSTETRRTAGNSSEAKLATAIKSSLKLVGFSKETGNERFKLENLSYTISCPPKAVGKRGQSFLVDATTTTLAQVFRTATEDYDHCVVNLASLHVEMLETPLSAASAKIAWTCDLNPQRGIRTLTNPQIPSNLITSAGPTMTQALAAMHSCIPKSMALALVPTPTTRALVLANEFPSDSISNLLFTPNIEVAFEEAALPTTTTASADNLSGTVDAAPVIPVQTDVLTTTSLGAGLLATVSATFKCTNLVASGFPVDASKYPQGDAAIQQKNPWCTAVSLRHIYAAAINCSTLNAASPTNVPENKLLIPEPNADLRFRHIANPESGAVVWLADAPDSFTAALPFNGKVTGKTCVVLAIPTSAPFATSTVVPPSTATHTYAYTSFNPELPDPSNCLLGVAAFTNTGAKLLSQIDFDSAVRLGRISGDPDDSQNDPTVLLPYSTQILRDLAPANSASGNRTKTHIRDAAIVNSYDNSCSRRALRIARSVTPAGETSDINSKMGLEIELGDVTGTTLSNLFNDVDAPKATKGFTLGFMHARDANPTDPAAVPGVDGLSAKIPVLGFGHMDASATTAGAGTNRVNGIYWQSKSNADGSSRWALCLKLHARPDDACISKTLAIDNKLAPLNPLKTFVTLTMERRGATEDASGTVYVTLFANGQIGFFDGLGLPSAIELRAAEATQILAGISRFVLGANLEKSAHGDADYNSWFVLDRPLNPAEVRTVAQNIDASIIPNTGEPGSTAQNRVTVAVSTEGGTVTGINGQTCNANSTESAAVTPGTSLTLRANNVRGFAFKSWSGDCSGSGQVCTLPNIRSDKNISAAFQPLEAKISVSADSGGSIKISSLKIRSLFISGDAGTEISFDAGETVTLTATPSDGSTFSGWKGGLCANPLAEECRITIDPATWDFDSVKPALATFLPRRYALTASVSSAIQVTAPDFPGKVEKGGVAISTIEIEHGSTLLLNAMPHSPKFLFKQWDLAGPCKLQGATCTVVVSGAIAITAEFEALYKLSVSVASTLPSTQSITVNFGSIQKSIAGGQTAILAENLTSGTATTVTLGPVTGYTCTSSGPTTIPSADATITVNCVQNTYALTLTPPSNGGIAVSSTTPANAVSPYPHGTQVIITASAATGYSFGSWTGTCLGITTSGCTVTMDSAKTVGATFTIQTFTVTGSALPTAGATVALSPTAGPYRYNDSVTFTPSLTAGYALKATARWTLNPTTATVVSGCTDAAVACQVTITSNTTVTANVEQLSYTVSGVALPSAGATVALSPAAGPYRYNDSVTFTPSLTSGYRLKNVGRWTLNPTTAVIVSGCTDAAVACQVRITGNTTVTANVEALYRLSINATGPVTGLPIAISYYVPSIVGATSTGITFNASTLTLATGIPSGTSYTVQVTSTPSGYTCNQPSNMVGTIGSTDVLLTINCAVTTYSLSASAGAGGSVSPTSGTYNYGATAYVYAYPSAGYTFSSWSGDCNGQGSTCSLSMTANKSATANFNQPTCGVNSSWNGSSCVCNSGYSLVNGSCQATCPSYNWTASQQLLCGPNPESCGGTIWGTGVYTYDSHPCKAARHCNAIGTNGGSISTTYLGSRPSFVGTTSNGITSLDYGTYNAYQISGCSAASTPTPTPTPTPAATVYASCAVIRCASTCANTYPYAQANCPGSYIISAGSIAHGVSIFKVMVPCGTKYFYATSSSEATLNNLNFGTVTCNNGYLP